MSISVEEFAANMIRILSERQPQPMTYLLAGNLISALQMSLVSTNVSAEFPKMLYRPMRDAPDATRVVEDATEQQAAEDAGFRTTPSPLPAGYPKEFVEVDPSRGSDYRRVRIRNAQEEQTFLAVVELKDDGTPLKWARDDAYQLAGRPIGLDELVTEHKEMLKSKIDQDQPKIVNTDT